jgi:hypothetical protein
VEGRLAGRDYSADPGGAEGAQRKLGRELCGHGRVRSLTARLRPCRSRVPFLVRGFSCTGVTGS